MKVFASRLMPVDLLQPIVDAGWSVDMYEHDSACPRPAMFERSRDADAVLVQGTDKIDREFFENARKLKVVACCSLGYDNVDLGAAASHDVVVCNAPDPDLVASTAEAAVALLLGVAKRVTRLHLGQQEGDLPRYSFVEPMGLPVRDKVCGIVGPGRIGSAIAKIMSGAFDNSILYFSRTDKPELEQTLGAERRELDKLLSESDFVFVVVPLSEDTENLIARENLQHLGRDAIVVNIARAGIIDDAALMELLDENRIFGAGLDVYDPVITACRHPNLVLTAHMANGENKAVRAVIKMAARNVIAVLSNEEPISPVSQATADR